MKKLYLPTLLSVVLFTFCFSMSLFAQYSQAIAWGSNRYGQLGNGNRYNSITPVEIINSDSVTKIDASFHTLILFQDGSVKACGLNSFGQLGNGTTTDSLIPIQVMGLQDIADIAAGYSHSLALKSDGTVWAWGNNSLGQLGDGTYTDRTTPVKVLNLDNVIKISTYHSHSIALENDGTVWAWGNNESGQLGTGNYNSSPVPIQVQNLNNVIEIAAGYLHSLALKGNGEVWAWGSNYKGQLGNGTYSSSNTPVQILDLDGIIFIDAGSQSSYALKSDGSVWAWGDNSYGQLGKGSYYSINFPVMIDSLEQIVAISSNYRHVLALKEDGTLYGWGTNFDGELGIEGGGYKNTPQTLFQISGLVNICAGMGHSVCIVNCNPVIFPSTIIDITDYDGACDGVKIDFQNGAPATRHDLYVDGILVEKGISNPCFFNPFDTFEHIYIIRAVNNYSVCHLDSLPFSYSDSTNGTPSTPIISQITDLDPNLLSGVQIIFVQGSPSTKNDLYVDGVLQAENIANGYIYYSQDSEIHRFQIKTYNDECFSESEIFLARDNAVPDYLSRVYAWGKNTLGQLGNGFSGTGKELYLPNQVPNLENVITVSAGQKHVLAVSNDRKVWAWGNNESGQLGNGSTTNSNVPVQVNNLNNIVAVSSGYCHSLAVDTDGNAWAWGLNNTGQLGNETTSNSYVPLQVSSISNVVNISAGYYHSVALLNDGSVWAWGDNYDGQLGDGTYDMRLTPVKSQISNVIEISTGFSHTIALKEDGTVWAWGSNTEGQLGAGNYVSSNFPVQVVGLSDVVSISTKRYACYAVKSDGTLWKWGDSVNTPFKFDERDGYDKVAAGFNHFLTVKTDNSVWSAGNNYYGQLGTGKLEGSNSLGPVAKLGFCSMISAGEDFSVAIAYCYSPTVQPSITDISDAPDACDGIYIYFNEGYPYRRHDLYVDGELVQSEISTPVYYNPKDRQSHLYVVRAVNEEEFCYFDSDATAYSDITNSTPTKAVITQIVDINSNLSNGIRIYFNPGITANRHDLYVDGTLKIEGFLSGEIYIPNDRNVHLFTVRAYNGECYSDSDFKLFSDKSKEYYYSSVYAWGYNFYGELGNGNRRNSCVPVEVLNLDNVIQVAANAMNSYALKSDGTIWGWGYDGNGELKNDSCIYCTEPSPIFGLQEFVQISANYDHVLALKSNGTIWAWGFNTYGQLGNGEFDFGSYYRDPVEVLNMSDAVQVAAGTHFSLALKNDGTVWAWGRNDEGQLGLGDYLNRNIPVQVNGLRNIIAISAHSARASAIDINGNLWSWGKCYLGDGYYQGSSVPVKIDTITDVKSIATGNYYSVALKKDGTLWNWGNLTSSVKIYEPQMINSSAKMDFIVANEHSMAINENASAWAWGSNERGQLGLGDFNYRTCPTEITRISNVADVAVGKDHSLAVVQCTIPQAPVINSITDLASNCDGVIIEFSPSAQATRHDLYVDGNLAVKDVTNPVIYNSWDRAEHIFVIRAINILDKCFADSNGVAFADTLNDTPTKPVMVNVLDNNLNAISGVKIYFNISPEAERHDLYVDDIKRAQNIYSGYIFQPNDTVTHKYFIRAVFQDCFRDSDVILARDNGFNEVDTVALSWGSNIYGQLGTGNNDRSSVPVLVLGMDNVVEVSAGIDNFSIALKADGTVWSWGYNRFGQLGTGNYIDSNIPVQVTNLNNIVSISAGHRHSLALRNDGTVWQWGDNINVPYQISGLSDIVEISTYYDHNLALSKTGEVFGWGPNYDGQLGLGYYGGFITVPVQISTLHDIVKISAGYNHSIVLTKDGYVYSSGGNAYSQLGDGTFNDSCVFIKTSLLSDVLDISAGYFNSFAVRSDNTLWGWGSNYYGSLGCGDNNLKRTPVQIQLLNNVTKARSGIDYSLMLTQTGLAWGSGVNASGQLGNLDVDFTNIPVPVYDLVGAIDISAGEYHSLAIKQSSICELPSSPTLLGIMDNDICSSDGLTITFSPGSPSTRHDLFKDNEKVLINVASPFTYLPEDNIIHEYKIRAINYVENCFNDSEILSLSDQSISTVPTISGGHQNECPSESVLLSTQEGNTNYRWFRNGSEISGTNNSFYYVLSSGNYTVSFTDSNGCSGTSEPHSVTIIPCVVDIFYNSHSNFSEVTGDGDSYLEKGELWSVAVTLTNTGNTPATSVTAKLSGNGITVCNNPGFYETILPSGTSTFVYQFLINSDFTPCGGNINFSVINKACNEKTPAGLDETEIFSIQVGEISVGVPTETVFNAVSDSWVNQLNTYSNTNYGTDTSLYVQSKSLQARRTLIKFDLSSIPSGSVINSATLEMYETSALGNTLINLHRITGEWTEATVTWNNQPSYDATVISSLQSSETGWKIFNVKSLIEGYVNGTYANKGILIKCDTETEFLTLNKVFASRENGTETNRPILRINYTPPTTMDCSYIGNGQCLAVIPPEVAPGITYENSQMWSEDKSMQLWQPVSGADGYKVYRGIQVNLPNLLTIETDSCLRYEGLNTTVDLSTDDPSSEEGRFYWYIVTAYSSGGEGSSGKDSNNNQRVVNPIGSCQ